MGEEDLGDCRSNWEFYLFLLMLWGTTGGFEQRNKTDFFKKESHTSSYVKENSQVFRLKNWKKENTSFHFIQWLYLENLGSIHFYSSIVSLQPNHHHFLSNLKYYHHKWFAIISSCPHLVCLAEIRRIIETYEAPQWLTYWLRMWLNSLWPAR